MSKIYSSEGCADAMVADGYTAEEANYIDNSIIQQMREGIESLRAALEPLARLQIPNKPQGNAGAYSIRFADIQRAKEILGYGQGADK